MKKAKIQKIISCPYCVAPNSPRVTKIRGLYRVVHDRCGTIGSMSETIDGAISLWNCAAEWIRGRDWPMSLDDGNSPVTMFVLDPEDFSGGDLGERKETEFI